MKTEFNGLDPFKQIIKEKNITKERLAQMWCELNRWEIPKEFSGEILIHAPGKAQKGSLAMKDIEKIVGKKKCLEAWNKMERINESK